MSGCGNCAGCSGCSSRGGALELTEQEMSFLRLLGQLAFLPLTWEAGDPTPICPEASGSREQTAGMLRHLEAMALISLDYDKPLKGWQTDGSIALTQRGQQVLEIMDYLGVSQA